MKYELYKELTSRVDGDVYENLSSYLIERGMRNIVKGYKIMGQTPELEARISIKSTLYRRKIKGKLKATIKTKDNTRRTQERATQILTDLLNYEIKSSPALPSKQIHIDS